MQEIAVRGKFPPVELGTLLGGIFLPGEWGNLRKSDFDDPNHFKS